mmetsp:Transcript_43224/g.41577  ORF Transcript_43224/g.41577 Transcript_43224/m.41577 type:complete len:129 (-) Transcript_43224:44-430(-)
MWMGATEFVRKSRFEEAYRLVLKEGDDLYLMRLVAQTGPVIKFLEDQTAIQVINKMNRILRSGALELMEVQWIEQAEKVGLFSKMKPQEQNEYLDSLYWFSKAKVNPRISEMAASAYNHLKDSIPEKQ